MAPFRFPGPQCRYRLLNEIDSGTLCRGASQAPAPTDSFSIWPEMQSPDFLPAALGLSSAVTAADKAEFAIIKKMRVLDSKHRPYRNVRQYVSDRTLYFGSPSAYASFATESDAELLDTKWVRKKHTRTLRSQIEFNNEPKKQKIFYRWVRKAYEHKYGPDVDVTELIRKGMSKELDEKIKEVRGTIRVKRIHDEQFHTGGFNPRPIKFSNHYLLGTLSEHATGLAVDIDDQQNAQLTTEEWTFIENLVGKRIVRSGRWATEDDAEELWNDIVEINGLFTNKIAAEVKRIEQERANEAKAQEQNASHAHPPRPRIVLPPLEKILGEHFARLSPWVKTGFFHLPLELVLELHAHGFTWGAGFSTNVDLHHFELDE